MPETTEKKCDRSRVGVQAKVTGMSAATRPHQTPARPRSKRRARSALAALLLSSQSGRLGSSFASLLGLKGPKDARVRARGRAEAEKHIFVRAPRGGPWRQRAAFSQRSERPLKQSGAGAPARLTRKPLLRQLSGSGSGLRVAPGRGCWARCPYLLLSRESASKNSHVDLEHQSSLKCLPKFHPRCCPGGSLLLPYDHHNKLLIVRFLYYGLHLM